MSDDPDPGQRSSNATATEAAASGHVIDILFPEDQSSEESRVLVARLRMAAETALDMAETGPGALTLVLSRDDEVRVLNRQFRGADKPTNVLSFPADATMPEPDEPPYLGDVILARETLAREAAAQGKSFLDHATHLAIHGVLHLLGHTHEAEEDAARMEALEVAALSRLGVPDPYVETTLAST